MNMDIINMILLIILIILMIIVIVMLALKKTDISELMDDESNIKGYIDSKNP